MDNLPKNPKVVEMVLVHPNAAPFFRLECEFIRFLV